MLEVLCCCKPENLMGYLPESSEDLPKRELEGGGVAFSSEERPLSELLDIEGFLPFRGTQHGRKTWKKTWKK